jgi:hypothetical protein
MQDFRAKLETIPFNKPKDEMLSKSLVRDLQESSYQLSRALRTSIEASWDVNLSEVKK